MFAGVERAGLQFPSSIYNSGPVASRPAGEFESVGKNAGFLSDSGLSVVPVDVGSGQDLAAAPSVIVVTMPGLRLPGVLGGASDDIDVMLPCEKGDPVFTFRGLGVVSLDIVRYMLRGACYWANQPSLGVGNTWYKLLVMIGAVDHAHRPVYPPRILSGLHLVTYLCRRVVRPLGVVVSVKSESRNRVAAHTAVSVCVDGLAYSVASVWDTRELSGLDSLSLAVCLLPRRDLPDGYAIDRSRPGFLVRCGAFSDAAGGVDVKPFVSLVGVATEGVGWWDFGTLLRGVSDSVVDLSVVCGPYCVAPWESDFLEVALGAGGDPGLPEAGLGDVVVEDLGFSIWDDSEEDEDSEFIDGVLDELMEFAVKSGKMFSDGDDSGEHVGFGVSGFELKEVKQAFAMEFGDDLKNVIDYFEREDYLGVSEDELRNIVRAVCDMNIERKELFVQKLVDLEPSNFADQLIVGLCSDSTNVYFRSKQRLFDRYNHICSGAALLLLRGLSKRFRDQLYGVYRSMAAGFDFKDKFSVVDVSSIVDGDYLSMISGVLDGLKGDGDLIFMQELWNATPMCDLKRRVFKMTGVTSLGSIKKYRGAVKNAKCAITESLNSFFIKHMNAVGNEDGLRFPVLLDHLTSMSPVLMLEADELNVFKNYFEGFGASGSGLIDTHISLQITYFKYQCFDILRELSADSLRHTIGEFKVDDDIKNTREGGPSGYASSLESGSLGDPDKSRPVSGVSDTPSKRKIAMDTFGVSLGLAQRYEGFKEFFDKPGVGDAGFSDERLRYIEKHFDDHQTKKDKLYFQELWDKRPGSPHWAFIQDKVCAYLGVDSEFLKSDASRKREKETKEKNNEFLKALSAAVKTSTVDLSVNKTEVEFFNDSQLRALSGWFRSRGADKDVETLLELLKDKPLTYLEFQVADAFDLLSEPGPSVEIGGSEVNNSSEPGEGFATAASENSGSSGENLSLVESSEGEGVSMRATRSRVRQPSLDRSMPPRKDVSNRQKPRPRSLDLKIQVSFIPLEAALAKELAIFFTDPFDINVPGELTMRFDKNGIDGSVVNGTITNNSEPHVTVGSEKYDTVIDVLAAHLGVENVDIKADIRFFVKIQGPYRKRLIRDNYIRIQETIQHSTPMTVEVTGDALVALLKDNGIPYDLESDGLNKLLLRVIRKSRNPGNFVYSTLAHCFFRTILVVSYNDGQPKLQKFTTANKCGNPPLVIYFDGIKYYLGNVHRYLDSMLERGALVASRKFSQLVDGVCDVVYVSNAINLGESDINYSRALNVFKDLFENNCHMTVFVLAVLNTLRNVTWDQYSDSLVPLSLVYSLYVTHYFKSDGDYELPSVKKVELLREIFKLLKCKLAPATLRTINDVILSKPNLKYGSFLSNESDDTSTRESYSDTSTMEPSESQGVRRRSKSTLALPDES